jgi:hypothetical protein
VSIVAVPPGTVAAQVMRVVWTERPRREQLSRTVIPALSTYDPGRIQIVTPPAGMLAKPFKYETAALTVRKGNPFSAPVVSFPKT